MKVWVFGLVSVLMGGCGLTDSTSDVRVNRSSADGITLSDEGQKQGKKSSKDGKDDNQSTKGEQCELHLGMVNRPLFSLV